MESASKKAPEKQSEQHQKDLLPRILSRCDDWVICVKPVGLDSESAFPALLVWEVFVRDAEA